MKISVVVTVLNEAETIRLLLFGLLFQTHQPQEIIIVDAGSSDGTVQLIKVYQKKHPHFPLKVFTKKGNRSVGRNYAIQQAKFEWIAITDAGCIPHDDWLEKLVKSALLNQADVVAGFYGSSPRNAFETAVAPYMLVMPDKVDENNFLPATRSMLLKKQAWKKVGGFNESLILSEDYDFAHRLKKAKFKFAFAKDALVAWWPIGSLKSFYQTTKGMAQFDAQAGLIRTKVYLVFARYLIFLLLLFQPGLAAVGALIYLWWSVWKNFQYLNHGWYYLPLLQVVSDLGVMTGSIRGIISPYVKRST